MLCGGPPPRPSTSRGPKYFADATRCEQADHYTGALFDVGEEGAWDELFIGSPQMLATGPKDMRMYYHSYDRSRARFVVGMARSEDGFKWSKSGVVFDPREAGAGVGDHDELGAASICVVSRNMARVPNGMNKNNGRLG
eukprot:89759-Chlamydomonas_euryale.AAC.1